MDSKPWYASKTIWFVIVWFIVRVANLFGYADFHIDPQISSLIDLALPIIVGWLRLITRQPVTIVKN